MGLLDKLFGKKENGKIDQPLEASIYDKKEDKVEYVNLGQNIFPIIKSEDDNNIKLSIKSNPILNDRLIEGIVICYILDLGNKKELLNNTHLSDIGLTIEDIRQVANRNLTIKANENCQIGAVDLSSLSPQARPFYQVKISNDINPSMFLLDEFWDVNMNEYLKSDTIAVSMPTNNTLLFCSLKKMRSFLTMEATAASQYESAIAEGRALTRNIYIRKNKKWILFLNTEEQMETLLL